VLSCREVVNRSSDLLDGELAGLSRFQMRLHLFMCHRCRSFLDFLTRLHRELPELVVQDGDGEAVDRIANDDTLVPLPVTQSDRFDDAFAHFRHKHGSYWRWIRPVFDGASRSAANARIEFRPLPSQPTLSDAVAFQAVFGGLMEALPRVEHPIQGLDWETARENFDAAASDGLRADMEWITVDGTHTADTDQLYGELFEIAREGLEQRGLSTEEAHSYVRPLRERVDRRLTPARWKHDQVREAVDENVPLAEAIWGMQSRYVDRQEGTLLEGSFVDWL
jgi:hypothetical protein